MSKKRLSFAIILSAVLILTACATKRSEGISTTMGGTLDNPESTENAEIILRSELFNYIKVGMDHAEVSAILDHHGNFPLSSSKPDAAYLGDNGDVLYVYYDIRQDEFTSQNIFTVKSVKMENSGTSSSEPTRIPYKDDLVEISKIPYELLCDIKSGMKRSEVNNKIASDGILISSVDLEYGYLSDNGKILLVTYSLPNATDTELVVSKVEFIDTGEFLLHSLSYLQPVTDVNRSDVEKLEIGMTVSMACSILGGSGEINDTDEQTITYCVSDGSVLTLKYGYAKGGFKKWDNWRILDIQILPEQG